MSVRTSEGVDHLGGLRKSAVSGLAYLGPQFSLMFADSGDPQSWRKRRGVWIHRGRETQRNAEPPGSTPVAVHIQFDASSLYSPLLQASCKCFPIGKMVYLADLRGNAKARAKSFAMSACCDVEWLGYLYLQVLPMGLASAVGVMQAIRRRIVYPSLQAGLACRAFPSSGRLVDFRRSLTSGSAKIRLFTQTISQRQEWRRRYLEKAEGQLHR